MRVAYDFHIHTALSPCGDDAMTPHNIINMCQLNGVEMIAITDHNTCKNCQAVMTVGEQKGVLVIPGMEIECMEEFHNIALFPDLEAAQQVERQLAAYRLPIKNKIKVFGHQQIFNHEDEVIGEEALLLVTAIQVPAVQIYDWVREVGGVIYPAHMDKPSYSVISNLGSLPPELQATTLEVADLRKIDAYQQQYPNQWIVSSSDAHYLEQLCRTQSYLEINRFNCAEVIKKLRNNIL